MFRLALCKPGIDAPIDLDRLRPSFAEHDAPVTLAQVNLNGRSFLEVRRGRSRPAPISGSDMMVPMPTIAA